MDVRVGCPRVPEQAACEADKGGEEGDWKTPLGDRNIIVMERAALVVGILEEAGQDPEEKAGEDGYLEEAGFKNVRVI